MTSTFIKGNLEIQTPITGAYIGMSMGRHSEKVAICKPRKKTSEETSSASTLILGFQSPQLLENKSLLFKLPSLWCFVMVVQTTNPKFSVPIFTKYSGENIHNFISLAWKD